MKIKNKVKSQDHKYQRNKQARPQSMKANGLVAALTVLALTLPQCCRSSSSTSLASPPVTITPTSLVPCVNCDLWVGVGVGLGVSAFILLVLFAMVVTLLVVKKMTRRSHSYQPLTTMKLWSLLWTAVINVFQIVNCNVYVSSTNHLRTVLSEIFLQKYFTVCSKWLKWL